MPALTPRTIPMLSMVAILVVSLLQIPLVMVSVSVAVPIPAHIVPLPVIEILPALGKGFIVMALVAIAVPQLLVTV